MSWLDPLLLPRRILSDVQADLTSIKLIVLGTRTYIHRLENKIMATLDTLQAAVDRNGQAVAAAVTALVDQRSKIAALQAALDAEDIDTERIAAITASIDAASDAVAAALTPVVNDPDTDTGDTAPLPETNPDTAAPDEVPGSVPAGEPLPE